MCGGIDEARELGLKHGMVGQCKHCRSNKGRLKGNPQNHNRYEFIDDLCIGYTNDNKQFFIDKEDYKKLKIIVGT